MRILLSLHHKLDPNAGAAGVTLRLGEAFRSLGHTTGFLSMSDMKADESVMSQIRFPWFACQQLKRRYKEYDILDLSTGDGWVFQRAFPRIPQVVVTRSHGLEHAADRVLRQAVKRGQSALSWKYPIYHGGFRLWEVAQSLRGADLSLFLSREDLDYAVETLHVQPNRAHVVDNGIANSFVGLPFFPETAPGLRIAVVGAYSHRKINVLPTAINRLLPQKKKWKLGFFGTLVDDAEVRKDYADCIQSQISIIRRFNNADLPALLQGYDLLLFPSLSEGLPVSVFEAMACGLALVASALPTLTTRLTNGQEAIFFPPGDPEAIAGALTNIEQNSDKLLSIREAGYKRAQEFSWARVARTTAKLYEEAVHAKRAEARLWTV